MNDERKDHQNETQPEQTEQPKVSDLASKQPTREEAENVKGGVSGEHFKEVIIT
jgi:hypothetical protein